MINVFQPTLGDREIEAIRRVFAANWPGKGQVTDQFESAFATHLGVDRALVRSVSCCTEGLFQAIELLELGTGDEVVLPSISFIGAANAIAAVGAQPVFCDVDAATLNPTAADIDHKLTARSRAVLLLHYGGVPCEMDPILELVGRRGLWLVEDSACSPASSYRGRVCGTFGEIGIWSFDATKILVTGDGGMVYCRDLELARRLEERLYLGLKQQSGYTNKTQDRWWEFDVGSCSRRAVMNDIAAAMGVEQLNKLAPFVQRRRQIHAHYDHLLKGVDWVEGPPPVPRHAESSYFLYWIRTRAALRDPLARHLRQRGIYTTFRYYPLHKIPYYRDGSILPHAEEAADTALCLPLHQGLTERDLACIGEALDEFGREL